MESWNQRGLWVLIFCLIFQSCYGFYLSKSYPIYYTDELWVKVNHMNTLISDDTEIPFSYYTLPFCQPHGGVEYSAESLGKLITGYRVENSPYRFKVNTNESDIFLCRVESLSRDKFNLLTKSIDEMHHVNLILDNLSAIGFTQKEGKFMRRSGYPIGFKVQDDYYIFNHLKFNVLVHKYEEVDESFEKPRYMVVGFEVIPCSVKHKVDSVKDLKMYSKYPSPVICDLATVAMPIKEGQDVIFSYEVTFEESDIKWASRWDAYLKMEGAKVRWFAICSYLMVMTFGVSMSLLIFLCLFRRDFARYEELDKEAQEQMMEESSALRLVLADVFRTPSNLSLLCVMVGNGIQIIGMTMVSLIFSAVGFMSLVSRRTLFMDMLFFYMILSVPAGSVAVRLWRTFNQKGWILIALKTSCFFSFSFSILTFLHFIFWGISSSVPFIVIVLVWFCISIPLTLAGGYFGAKEPFIQIPVQTNAYPRNIPNQDMPSWLAVPFIGIHPFTIIFGELVIVMPILATSHVYFGIGFLFVVLINILVICVVVSFILTYYYLLKEDWAWWWKSFFASGCVAINIFFYSLCYLDFDLKSLKDPVLATKLVILWMGYSLFVVLAIMMATGTIGFLSSFWFVYYLYDAYMLKQMKSQDGIIHNLDI